MARLIEFGFAPRAASPAEDLVALWQRARLNAETAPACPCHGIVAGRIDADAMETNVLAPLRTRYRGGTGAADVELSAVIDKRLRKSPFAGLRQPFEQWLRELSTMPLAPEAHRMLLADLSAALKDYAEALPAFACT